MLNVAICDDDIQDVEIEVFWNGENLVESIEKGDFFDIIFLDIEMEREDGISAAKRIRNFDKNVLIIYVTSYENHMKESFAVRPFRFLIKPVNEKIIMTCFKAAYEEITSGDYYFRYSFQRVNHKVAIKDILYFESNKLRLPIP